MLWMKKEFFNTLINEGGIMAITPSHLTHLYMYLLKHKKYNDSKHDIYVPPIKIKFFIFYLLVLYFDIFRFLYLKNT